jgi:hypothetical protein
MWLGREGSWNGSDRAWMQSSVAGQVFEEKAEGGIGWNLNQADHA